MKRLLHLTVNGEPRDLVVASNRTLLEILREDLGLIGTKQGCDTGECGSCTVLMDGVPVNSCIVLAVLARGKQITTIEGLADHGRPHPLQVAFHQLGAVQCGFCTPGMLLSAKAFLEENPTPTEDDVKRGLSGNLCRCTGYVKIVQAVTAASMAMKRDNHG